MGITPIGEKGEIIMIKESLKLPGNGIRILSYIPVFNCFALIYIGLSNGNLVNAISGAIYFVVSMAVPDISFFFWIVCIIHYRMAYKGIKKKMDDFNVVSDIPTKQPFKSQSQNEQGFSDVTISGGEEQKQSIPTKPTFVYTPITASYSYGTSQSKFFKDMTKYENKSNAKVPFEPFMTYWPNYDSMTKNQQKWYFYWRSEVRNQNYIDTDLSYIFVYIYELLSEVGWRTPDEGYEKLMQIWGAYQERYPKLSGYLNGWTYDFANLHNLEHRKADELKLQRLTPSARTDLMIENYRNDIPLKLPFELIDSLCDYSLVGSKFYKEGNQSLMREAIPRVVALADALLRREKEKGILDIYGPTRTKKQEYYAYASAVCPNANQKVSISIKAYSTSQKLREYINELVRYAENTLRALRGHRGRLRGITLDDEMANIIEAFLKKEYGNAQEANPIKEEKVSIELDFDNIDRLRMQSDAVRSALLVEEKVEKEEKELLTDVAEVSALVIALSAGAKTLLDRLRESSWESVQEAADKVLVAEINRLAEHYLGSHLLVVEKDFIIAEDDYRDELDYIYQNPSSIKKTIESQPDFSLGLLSERLKEFMTFLMPEHRKALYCIVMEDNVELKLDKIADDAMTMPQLIVDDINDVAMQVLGDIIIDPSLKIAEEYGEELKISV